VRQHDRVVVQVHHAGRGIDPLRDLVHVVRGRQPGAHVEQLAHPGLADQVADNAAEHRALGQHAGPHLGNRRDDPVG
jgi:hypothetical protein